MKSGNNTQGKEKRKKRFFHFVGCEREITEMIKKLLPVLAFCMIKGNFAKLICVFIIALLKNNR